MFLREKRSYYKVVFDCYQWYQTGIFISAFVVNPYTRFNGTGLVLIVFHLDLQ